MSSQLPLTRRQTGWTALLLSVVVVWFVLPVSLRNRIIPLAYAANLTVTNTNDDGAGSLRAAIAAANQDTNAAINVISFNIPGSGVHTITPLSPLPAVTTRLSIDGLSQPGAGRSNLLIEINGISAGPNANGLTINAGPCYIQGLIINRFKGSGIRLQSGNASLIADNRIGTDITGLQDLGNTVAGIRIENAGNTDIRSNLISGNDGPGVWIDNFDTQGTSLIGNRIGTNATATAALGNSTGVVISNETHHNVIGPAARVSSDVNIIAGNTFDGISIGGHSNQIQGNLIGNNGTSAIPNGQHGIFILSGASNTIGGTDPLAGNVISGNVANGIAINSTGAVGNKVTGNLIGVDQTTLQQPLPNGANGILVDVGASNNTIGGANTFSSLPRNFIAYNHGAGVRIERGIDNKIIENYIHDNTGAGVFINWPNEETTSVLGNRIFNDGGLGIDLAPVGITPNDPGDVDAGANALQNFPLLTLAAATPNYTLITGTLNSQPNRAYRLEFFANSNCDPSGNGEAEAYLGFMSATTDASGNASFQFFSSQGAGAGAGQLVVATATDPLGNTSELSPCLLIHDAGFFSFASFSTTVSETAGSITLTVTRSGDKVGAVSVDYATSDGDAVAGSDYTAVAGTLNFADGEGQKTITVAINNDSLPEGVEVFRVNLSNPRGGPSLGTPTSDVIIEDDEIPAGNVYVLTTANELLSFNTAHVDRTPASAVQINGEKILAIDFRPANGQLYGLGISGHLFTIDKATGALTQVGTATLGALGEYPSLGLDFNPITDRLRVALFDRRNLQLNPNTGAISTDGTLTFATTDPNSSLTPIILGLANSNNFTGATLTTTYGINWTGFFDLTKLVTLGSPGGSPVSPNSGQLFTVGTTNRATADFAGFDISDANEAFASLAHPEEGGEFTGLFKIDLTTAQATRLGTIGSNGRTPRDIALEPRQRVQFTAAVYSVNENAGTATITVKRNGGASGTVSVNYATSDGTATAGQDYITTSALLTFADGETSKTFTVPLSDDSLIEGVESINLNLNNATNGAVVGPQSTTIIAIMDEPTESGTNPIDNANFFVRQHYSDFLNRPPDSGGLAFWTNHITQCFNDPACINDRRIGTSAAFFIENEFQQTGFFIYRFYQAALGRRPTFTEFSTDRGQVIGGANLENGKQAFATEFVQRQAFLQKYPLSMDGPTFVDALINTASQASGLLDLSTRRDSLIAQYNLGANQTDSRVRVVRALTDDGAFSAALYNPAFVLMQYYGYLRRPADQNGYNFWLDHLNNRNPNNYRAMVCAFITSLEYQRRFSTITTRTNQDCAQ